MAFRTRTRIPVVDTVESRTTAPPPAVTIRGSATAADAAPPTVGMRANGVKDQNPLRDERNRWGKPSSAICRRN